VAKRLAGVLAIPVSLETLGNASLPPCRFHPIERGSFATLLRCSTIPQARGNYRIYNESSSISHLGVQVILISIV